MILDDPVSAKTVPFCVVARVWSIVAGRVNDGLNQVVAIREIGYMASRFLDQARA